MLLVRYAVLHVIVVGGSVAVFLVMGFATAVWLPTELAYIAVVAIAMYIVWRRWDRASSARESPPGPTVVAVAAFIAYVGVVTTLRILMWRHLAWRD